MRCCAVIKYRNYSAKFMCNNKKSYYQKIYSKWYIITFFSWNVWYISVIVHSDRIVLVLNDIKCIYWFPFSVRSDTYRMICWLTLRLHVRQGGARLNQKTGLRWLLGKCSRLSLCRPPLLPPPRPTQRRTQGGPPTPPHRQRAGRRGVCQKFLVSRNCRRNSFFF